MYVFKDISLFGQVIKVNNFGAGTILEIKTVGGKVLDFSFSKQTFPVVDTENKRLEIVLPIGMEKVIK